MTKWIASDLHINHRQILKYCPGRVHPSYQGDINEATENEIDTLIEAMNEKIISNWNSLIEPGDDVYILGDCAMGQIKYAPPLIRRLNGKKFLVAGNHDVSLKKLIRDNPELDDLFVWVKDYHEMTHTIDGVKHKLCMMHYPLKFWNGSGHGSIMAHGHCHGSPTGVDGRILDVGIDTNNLYPYLLDTAIAKVIKNSPSPHH